MHSDKVQAQIEIVKAALGPEAAVSEDGEGAGYLYRAHHVLVADEDVADLADYLASHPELYSGSGAVRESPSAGISLYSLPSRVDGATDPDAVTLREIDDALGRGVASPDHILYITTKVGSLCPATEPDETNRDRCWPRESRDTDRGAGVRINVVDTGWWTAAARDPDAPWLAYGVGGDAEQINPAAIQPYGGHGTFVAGVIKCRAPQAEIYIDGMLTHGGAVFESKLMHELDVAVLTGAPNIISISGGTHTYNDQPLKTFEHLARRHNLLENPLAPLIIAAAGNDSTDAPFWPAAFDWVVGVGSLDDDDTVSDYSNHGDWVDIYALGRDHVNAYPTGTYTCYEPPNVGQVRQFKNLAKWSGTSFSTPLITGIIAGLMSEHGLTAQQAWDKLKKGAIPRTDPRVGDILTVDTPGD